MFAIDTNIFVYAHFDRYPRHSKARKFCAKLLEGDQGWCFGWQVVYEYIRITTHPSVHNAPLSFDEALNDLRPYLLSGNAQILTPTAQHLPVLDSVSKTIPGARGNFVHDVHYAALLREHGVSEIYTADMDFRKFGFLSVIDPTA